MCDAHMLLILQAEANYDSTSNYDYALESEDDCIFDELSKSYYKDSVRHYMGKVYDILPFEIFNEWFLKVVLGLLI